MENLVEQLQSLRCGEHLPDNRNGYWTEEQDKALIKSFDNGVGVSEIAVTLGRTELSVIGRLAFPADRTEHGDAQGGNLRPEVGLCGLSEWRHSCPKKSCI